MLIAAIIRDFWVVENRESVFKSRVNRRRIGKSSETDENRIIYLPRVRYAQKKVSEPDSPLRETSLRSAHKVRAHLRQSGEASLSQRALAKKYGFILPKGYTFVRPHRRGHLQKQTVYRSRSALKTLYTKLEFKEDTASQPLWFQFELDVREMLDKQGFITEHVAASRIGDDGVDIYAKKKDSNSSEHWLVQCKCYSPKNKVGKSIVRELIGTLVSESANVEARGMIITSSSLTEGAKKLAIKHQIKWIEGEELHQALSH